MFARIAFILAWPRRLAASRSNLLIENLALRQQLAILTAKRPRPRMCCATPCPGVRQRATLLSEVTHIDKDEPALRHPAGTTRKKSDRRV